MLFNVLEMYFLLIIIFLFVCLLVLKEILFIKCFNIVCKWWALMFLVFLFMWKVDLVILLILFWVNFIFIFLVFINLWYWRVSEVFGLVKICLKLFLVSDLSFIWIGKWFCNFGNKFDGWVIWNVFE